MKEQITVRLYEDAQRDAGCEHARYVIDPGVRGWDHDRGATLPLTEREGGRVFAVIDEVRDEVHEDDQGRYKLAVAWTQD